MSRKAYFYFAITFVLGVMIGGVGVASFGWYVMHMRPGMPNPEQVAHYLKKKLDLNDSQTQQVEQIVRDTRSKIFALGQQLEPQFQAIRTDGANRIRQILSPIQLEKFNALVAAWHKRHHFAEKSIPKPGPAH